MRFDISKIDSTVYLCFKISILTQFLRLLHKEFTVEFRKKHNIGSIFLFSIIIVYILYKAFNKMVGMEWNVMLWIVLLFSGVNAIAKSFSQEAIGTKQYYYHLVSPGLYLLSKLVYNILFLASIFIIILGGFSLLLGNPIIQPFYFTVCALLGVIGLGSIMTLVSAISSESEGGSALLMSVLTIPLTIPIILLMINCTASCIGRISDDQLISNLWMLGGIDLLLIGLSFILFNEVWRN